MTSSPSTKASNNQSAPQKLAAPEIARLESTISQAFERPDATQDPSVQDAIARVLRALEDGTLRVASPAGLGPDCGSVAMDGDLSSWVVHSWVKQAILLAFRWRSVQRLDVAPEGRGAAPAEGGPQARPHFGRFVYFDKFDVRADADAQGVRVVPPGVIREGAFVERGAILMPSFVNVGAHVGAGTMVDTWATVGSCAQVGRNVHLAGGVGLGGVLEPPGARPVLIGDDAFIGSRAIVVEGTIVSRGAVLGANVCLTASTPIYDVTTTERREHRGFVPPGAVVAPGTRPKTFPGGEVALQCAYIIAYRSEKTSAKVSLNDVLRETGLSV